MWLLTDVRNVDATPKLKILEEQDLIYNSIKTSLDFQNWATIFRGREWEAIFQEIPLTTPGLVMM